MYAIIYAAHSDPGHMREKNEDNLYLHGITLTAENRNESFILNGTVEPPCLFAICDGMGGQKDGEFASFAAVDALRELEKAIETEKPEKIHELVQAYVTKVNTLLCDKMREKSVRIGTTLALVIITDTKVLPYNIGDSRIYEYTDGKLRQISEDHTLTAQKVKMGVLTEEEARNDRDRHKLTRYLGIFEDEMVIEAEPLPALPLTECRRLLLCSDGLTDMVSDDRISEILRDMQTPDEAAGLLLKEALDNGGKDNTTVIVLDIPCIPLREERKSKMRSIFKSVNLVVIKLPKLIKRGGRGKK